MKKLLLFLLLIPILGFGQITIQNSNNNINIVKATGIEQMFRKDILSVNTDGRTIYFIYKDQRVPYKVPYAQVDAPVTTGIYDLMDTLNAYIAGSVEMELLFADGTELIHLNGKAQTFSHPYGYEIAEGNVPGHLSVYKFGANFDIGLTEETVWTEGGLYPWAGIDAAAGIVRISSSDADDDAGIAQIETQTIVGTIGAAGAGNMDVIITSSILAGSPLTIQVAVANDDTSDEVAAKVIAELELTAAVTDDYAIGGSVSDFTLTALVIAANDASLNIEYADGTSSGLTPDATSDNTRAGVAFGTGVWTCTIYGLSSVDSLSISETVTLDGQVAVNSTLSYYRVNRIICNTSGTDLQNAGVIYVGTGSVSSGVPAVKWAAVPIAHNQTLQCVFTVPINKTLYITSMLASTDSNKGDEVTIYFRPPNELFQIKFSHFLFSTNINHEWQFPQMIAGGTDIDLRAIGTAAGAKIGMSFEGWLE